MTDEQIGIRRQDGVAAKSPADAPRPAPIDVTGGNDPSIDEITAQTPSEPHYREGNNAWIWDDSGRIHIPRLGVESVGASWETGRLVHCNVATPDGRVLTTWEEGHRPVPVTDDAGRLRFVGAGPIRFECIEPFQRWHVTFDGKLSETTLKDQIAGRGPPAILPVDPQPGTVPVSIDLELTSVCPPWFQGSLGGKDYVPGEHRFEQLFRAQGRVRIDGEETPFSGGGLRIHRKGGNRTDSADFFGHCWHSAFFPSGRAFGFIHYYPRPDGSQKFCEGWALEDGKVVPAEILDRPWMQNSQVHDDKFSFVIRTAKGESRVEARTHASAFAPERQMRPGVTFPILQQGIGRYRCDGEEAYGMIERATRMEWPA